MPSYKIDFSQYFYYCETSKTGLRWKISPRSLVKVGDEAGCFNGKYFQVKLKKVCYLTHRVIWCILNTCELTSEMQIDHTDGDCTNNKIENLRLVTTRLNGKNKKLSKSNKSGFCGIFEINKKTKTGIKKYLKASCTDLDGKTLVKTKSLKNRNKDEVFEEIKQWLLDKRKEFGYTDRHGENLEENMKDTNNPETVLSVNGVNV